MSHQGLTVDVPTLSLSGFAFIEDARDIERIGLDVSRQL